MYYVVILILLPAACARSGYDYDALDPIIIPEISPGFTKTQGSMGSKASDTPENIKGDVLVQKILAGRLLPTQALHASTTPTTKLISLDTTLDTPSVTEHVDTRTAYLTTEKQAEEYNTGFFQEMPTRSPKYGFRDSVHGTTIEVDNEFVFSKNPTHVTTNQAAIVTRVAEVHGEMIETDVTLYDDTRHVLPENVIGLTPKPSRTPGVRSGIEGRDWYTALRNTDGTVDMEGHSNLREPVFRVLTRQSSTHSDTKAPGTWLKIRLTSSTTTRSWRRVRKKTTTTTTPLTTAAPCFDDMGYKVRCPNTTTPPSTFTAESTERNTTTTATTTEPPPTTINTTSINTTTTFTTTTPTTPTPPTLNDIDKLLLILDNLTYIYETRLVQDFNETLHELGYPYCPTTQTTTTTTETYVVDNLTGIVTTKCYVCGLDAEGIPHDSNCADAFASDFFPMAPVDFTSRRYMDEFKKQCRYMDMAKWHVNGTRGRSMWGKWTGGCAVRWLDISGVYTQRTCRNRHRPVLGHHFASKRMAKLEWALFREDNGCIISPQASLVPFSRGISLYARFHACVCTGNYCNHAERISTINNWLMVAFTLVLVYYNKDYRMEDS